MAPTPNQNQAIVAEPWHAWPRELPTCAEEHNDIPEYQFLNNEEFHRDLVKEIRENVMANVGELRASGKGFSGSNAAIVLKGGTSDDWALYDSDTEKAPFLQEAFFKYMFTLNEPDCYGVLDIQTGESMLFTPSVSLDASRWNGPAREGSYYIQRYGVSEHHPLSDLQKVLTAKYKTLYVLEGVNTDSGCKTRTTANFEGIDKFEVNRTDLYPLLVDMRVYKTHKEVELLRVACRVSCMAHLYVMRHVKPGMVEIQLESLFKSWCSYYAGSRHVSYTCICGSGCNAAILHYGHAGRPNDKPMEPSDIVLLDMGSEYSGYATDITRSYPVNGKFTDDQKLIFNAVRATQVACFEMMKPGVYWPDVHRKAESVIIEHLLAIGILHNGTHEDMVAAHMGSVFMPHGLGHFMGLNVHDVGGYPEGVKRLTDPGVCWLRCGRTLEKGMVITVEPGIYFPEMWINRILETRPEQAKYINVDVLSRFRSFGGIRLEDDVLITEDGIENFVTLPSTVEEIEAVMSKK